MRASPLVALLALVLASGLHAQAPQPDAEAAIARTFIASMAANDFGAAVGRFDTTMRAALPEDRLAATWTRVVTEAGPFKRILSSRKEARGPFLIVSTTCQFERFDLDIVTTFNPAGEIAGLSFPPQSIQRPGATAPSWTPPPYATPAAYTETDVTIGAGTDWPLPATLTVPVGPGPFAVVVLVHGSGPNDRDETVGAAKPFADLALGLASRGVAVLRYDKRTRVHAAKVTASLATTPFTVKDETIDDVVAAVALVRGQPRIDPSRVFVAGHSLGGMLIPRIAARNPGARGFIVMAGNTRSIDRAMLEQTQYLAGLDGQITADEEQRIATLRNLVETIASLPDSDATNGRPIMSAPVSYWIDLRGFDPAAASRTIAQPMLVLQGERDYQVTMAEFANWKTALGGKSNATFKSYAPLNHLFIAGSGPGSPEEYVKPGHVDETVIRDIGDWIREH